MKKVWLSLLLVVASCGGQDSGPDFTVSYDSELAQSDSVVLRLPPTSGQIELFPSEGFTVQSVNLAELLEEDPNRLLLDGCDDPGCNVRFNIDRSGLGSEDVGITYLVNDSEYVDNIQFDYGP